MDLTGVALTDNVTLNLFNIRIVLRYLPSEPRFYPVHNDSGSTAPWQTQMLIS